MRKLVDPFLIVGILLLVVLERSTTWLTYHPLTHPARTLVLAVNWISGTGGVMCVVGGIVRATVRVALDRRYVVAAVFYVGFWLLLASPVIIADLQGEDTAPGGALWWGFLSMLFPITSALTVAAYLVGRYFRNRAV
jgi:hypothetical protein